MVGVCAGHSVRRFRVFMITLVDRSGGAGVVCIYYSFLGLDCKRSLPINVLPHKSKIKYSLVTLVSGTGVFLVSFFLFRSHVYGNPMGIPWKSDGKIMKSLPSWEES